MKGGLLSTESTAKPNHGTTSTWEGSSAFERSTPSAEKGPTKPKDEEFQNGGGKCRVFCLRNLGLKPGGLALPLAILRFV